MLVGGGAVNDADPDSTGLSPAWRKDAIVSWTILGAWPNSVPEGMIKEIKANVTRVVQDLGEVADLDHASYFNEADP
jgi:hypothetical protein